MNSRNFFAELKRRSVYKVTVAYAVAGWLVIQIATQVLPFWEIPNWVVRLVIALVALGFPIAAVSAWAFDITPQGIRRTEIADALPPSEHRQHAWIYVVLICGAVSAALFFLAVTLPEGKLKQLARSQTNPSPFCRLRISVKTKRLCSLPMAFRTRY